MQSLPDGYRALVVGASGAIGYAFATKLGADPRCGHVLALHRSSRPAVDYSREASIEAAAAVVAEGGPVHLIVVATGLLHSAVDDVRPEKRLADLNYPMLEAVFRANTFGPALVLRHFAPLADRRRSVFALLSAKVGSIGDNRLGGWYGYRASKAALNMVLRTASIEMRRTHPGSVLVALHPGTVDSALSRPFGGKAIGRPPLQAASEMLAVLDRLGPADSGTFVTYAGEQLPW